MFGEEMKGKKNRIQNHFSFLFRVWCFSHFIILLLLSLFTLFRSLLLTEYDQNRYSRIYRVADCPICVVGEMTTYTPTPICISNAQLCRWRFVQFHLVPRIRYSSKFLENKYRNCSSFSRNKSFINSQNIPFTAASGAGTPDFLHFRSLRNVQIPRTVKKQNQ